MTKTTVLSIFLLSMVLTGCEVSPSTSIIEIKPANHRQETKEYVFQLDEEGRLHLTGKVQLTSGEVILTLKSLDREETFYSKIFSQSDTVAIDIENGASNERFLLSAQFYDTIDVYVKLESNQKLLPDIEVEKPERPEKISSAKDYEAGYTM